MKRILILLTAAAVLTGCACSEAPASPLPTPLKSQQMLENHVLSAVAAELPSDWPLEALKAQAIIERTNAYRLLTEGVNRFDDTQTSTHIGERVRKAVQSTEGLIILHGEKPIHAWYHEHAGGVTAGACEGLNYPHAEPPYTRSIQVRESTGAPESLRTWTVQFPLTQVQQVLDDLGGGDAAQLSIASRGPSGRVITFDAGDATVSAVQLRAALGSDRIKSTLLTDVIVQNGQVAFSGAGSGHGVGLSQWGAYEMASEGRTAEDILHKFYADIKIAPMP